MHRRNIYYQNAATHQSRMDQELDAQTRESKMAANRADFSKTVALSKRKQLAAGPTLDSLELKGLNSQTSQKQF